MTRIFLKVDFGHESAVDDCNAEGEYREDSGLKHRETYIK